MKPPGGVSPQCPDHAPSTVGRPLLPALVLALDGATFDVIEPMIAGGALPNLEQLMKEGARRPLPSTTPPVTFPAWSSFMTGLDPGEHGIFDFTQKVEGQYRIRFVNASDRRGRSLQRAVSDAGGRALVLGLPATYPPERIEGLLVPGFDAPVSSASDAESTSDPALYRRIAERVGPWMRPDLKEGARQSDFHDRAVGTLLDRIDRKERFAVEAIAALREQGDGRSPELCVVVFSESDTVGHHYWRDHDSASPRHDAAADGTRRGAIRAVYARLDAACGRIREAYEQGAPDALCVVVSDHGMGGAARSVVHLNRFLHEQGLLARRPAGALDRMARAARDAALAVLPARIAQLLFRRARGAAARLESAARFGGFDWARTRAFSEEANTQPGVWINLRGREAAGCVAPEDYEALRDQLIEALLSWRGPGGAPVIARARRREDVYRGPYVTRAPDIVIELALDGGYGLSLVPTPWWEESGPSVRVLGDDALAGGRGRGMNGTHRQDGIFIARAPSDELAALLSPRALVDVAPCIARAMGLDFGEHRDARGSGEPMDDRREYSDEEDAMVAARLRAMGYLE